MKNKKVLKVLLILISVLIVIPTKVNAATTLHRATHNPYKSGEYNYNTKDYKINGKLVTRYTKNLHLYYSGSSNDKKYVFCLDPGRIFSEGSHNVTTWNKTTGKVPNISLTTKLSKAKVEKMEKVLSCYNDGPNSALATQAIIWELVTGERTTFNAVKPDHQISKSLSKIIIGKKSETPNATTVYNNYVALVNCAKRFDTRPSGTNFKLSLKSAATNASQTAVYSNTEILKINPSIAAQKDFFKYFKCTIGNTTADCKKGLISNGVKFVCNANKCSATTNQDYKNKDVNVKFTYAYKGIGDKLNTYKTVFYTKSNSQTLMKGHTTKSFTITLKASEAEKYVIKLKKVDDSGNLIKTNKAKFNVYNTNTPKSSEKPVCTVTLKDGVSSDCVVTRIGKFFVKEIVAPEGYNINNSYVPVTVNKTDTVSNVKNIKYNEIKNTRSVLHMFKRNEGAPLVDACVEEYCPKNENVGGLNGPIFTINPKDKSEFVCVEKTDNGKYIYVGTKTNCNDISDDATNYIQTCNGNFDIEGMPSGDYTIKEIAAACNTTLEGVPTQNFHLDKEYTVTFTNNFKGVMFYKKSEDGNLISGGKFALQRKENGIYKDLPLNKTEDGKYKYDGNLEADGDNILLETKEGTINVQELPVGEYRFVEKEAPEGYDIVKDKDSKATFLVSDRDKPLEVSMINKQTKTEGSYDTAELIVTIITGKKVINYGLIITGLVVLLVSLIILRKKFKK